MKKHSNNYFTYFIISIIVFALLNIIGIFINNASAATAATQTGGTEGTWVYTLLNGNATNVYCTTTTLTGNVVIPDALDGYPVTSIGGGASTTGVVYQSKANVTSIIIPNTVTIINNLAFDGCTGLTSISIPNTVTSIGYYAFYNCPGSTTNQIIIPKGVTSIGTSAFYGTKGVYYYPINAVALAKSGSLSEKHAWTPIEEGEVSNQVGGTEGKWIYTLSNGNATKVYCITTTLSGAVTVPTSIDGYPVTSIGGGTSAYGVVYLSKVNVTSIIIPNTVTIINNLAFDGCTGLTSISIPNSVTNIGEYGFQGCTGLTSVNIPNSVTSIGEFAFYDCTNLTTVNLPNAITAINTGTFDSTGLTSVNIPNSVTSIGAEAFQGCTGLTSVNIPNTVTSIRYYAFYNCPGSTTNQIIIPKGITSIGTSAFYRTKGVYYYPSNAVAVAASASYSGEYAWTPIVDETAPTVSVSVPVAPANPVIVTLTLTDDSSGVSSWAVTSSTAAPETWTTIPTSVSTTVTWEATENGTYYAWARDYFTNLSDYFMFTVATVSDPEEPPVGGGDEGGEEGEGEAVGVSDNARRYFKYYIGRDKNNITRVMLVAGNDNENVMTSFQRSDILDENNQYRNGIYYIDTKGKIQKYEI